LVIDDNNLYLDHLCYCISAHCMVCMVQTCLKSTKANKNTKQEAKNYDVTKKRRAQHW